MAASGPSKGSGTSGRSEAARTGGTLGAVGVVGAVGDAEAVDATPRDVDAALRLAARLGVERDDARRLLAHRLGRDRGWLIAHGDAPLPAGVSAAWSGDCRRLADDVPLAQLVGTQPFHGLDLAVTPDVLVPRADTAVLVEWALDVLPRAARGHAPTVLDLGTGSGAIALAIKRARPDASVLATDASAAALAVADANARRLRLQILFSHGDWWHALPDPELRPADGRFDAIVSNPPYIADGDPHLPALRHEPAAALVSGADGLGAIRAIVAGARAWLRPGGWLLLEHGADQGEAVRALLAAAGLGEVAGRRDLAGRDRCSGGRHVVEALGATRRS